MIRRTTAIGAASALALAFAALAPAAAAQARAVCVTDIVLPAKIVIDESKGTADAELNSSPRNCVKNAQYELQLNGNSLGTFAFSGASTEVFTVSDSDGPGEYTAVFVSGTDRSGNQIAGQDSDQPAVAKFGTRSSIVTSTRKGKTVTLAANVQEWSADFHDWDRSFRTSVRFQIKSAGGWQTLTTVKTNRNGSATATVNAKSTARQTFRVTTSEDGARWGSASKSVKR